MAANSLNKAIIACAWPYGTAKKKSIYPSGKPYGEFKKALTIAYPDRTSWSAYSAKGASSPVFVSSLLRYTKADKQFPKKLEDQLKYIAKAKTFSKIGKNLAKGKLKGGDIQVSDSGIRFIAEYKKKLYIVNASYKNKYYGKFVKQVPAKSTGYTTYRAKSASYNAVTATIAESEDRDYIRETIRLLKEISSYATGQKFTNVSSAVSSLLPKISLQLTYKELDNIVYKPLITTCENVVSSINKTQDNQLDQLNNELENLILNDADEDKIKAQSIKADKIVNNFKDTSGLEKYIYILKVYSLALRMQDEHTTKYKSFFHTQVFLDDQTKSNGVQYSIIQKYDDNEKIYRQLLNEAYEQLNYKISQTYTQRLNEYNQSLNEINIKINNLKEVIKTKSKDYFIVQDEIVKLDDIIKDITNRIILLEKDNFSDEYAYWNKNVILNPSVLNFWLEFLDTSGDLSQFNIGLIGDRSKTVNDTNATSIYFREIPQLIYLAPNDTHDASSFTGYTIVNIDSGLDSLFTLSARKKSVKDVIDENLYNHAYCAEEINVTAIPIYYLEPGIITSIYDKNSNINGNYVINTISLPLAYNGNMTLTASKMPTRLY